MTQPQRSPFEKKKNHFLKLEALKQEIGLGIEQEFMEIMGINRNKMET